MARPLGIHTPWKHTATGLAPLERTEQKQIIKLYRTVGCVVWILSQYRPRGPTKQSRGLPDLLVKHKTKRLSWTHESKALDGRLSKEQREYAEACLACGDLHVIGGYAAALTFLDHQGFITTIGKLPT